MGIVFFGIPILVFVLAIVFGIIIYRKDKRKYNRMLLERQNEEKKQYWWEVSDALNSIKKPEEFVLTQVKFQDEEDASKKYDMDIIYISTHGIIVIKANGEEGSIIGGKDDPYWLREKDSAEISFKNPIKENIVNVEFMENLVKKGYNVFNVVIFTHADIQKLYDSNGLVFTTQSFLEELEKRTDLLNEFDCAKVNNLISEYQTNNPCFK